MVDTQGGRNSPRAPVFNPGFRLSTRDVAFLVLGAIGAAAAAAFDGWFGIAVAFTVAHFFLFCNVIRMDRALELLWAALFVGLALSTLNAAQPAWPVTLLLALFATAILVLIQISKPSYHGVAWRRINPYLPNWWQSRHGAETPH